MSRGSGPTGVDRAVRDRNILGGRKEQREKARAVMYRAE